MTKFYSLVSSLFLFLLFLLMPQLAQAAEYKIVIRVVSGDTIIVDGGQAVRLIGVLSPQNDEYYAKETRQFLITQLLGQEVDLLDDNKNAITAHRDEYGRRLAYVYRVSDNYFVNGDLIRRGFCFYSNKYIQKNATDFLIYQQNARKQQVGVWQKTFSSPAEQAEIEKRPYQEPAFEFKPEYKNADIRVEILWAKKADPRVKITRSAEEAKFLGSLYTDPQLSEGKTPLLVQLRKNFALELTKYFQKQNVNLTIETVGDLAETLKFLADGMEQSDADQFCALPINKELFAGLEFKEVIFTNGSNFSYTYLVEQ
ncbi:MAG: thermonuclease family protein [Blastocatellia bacterium]|nr:thermonuclease family protein [Blastocatellia bacterium]MBL8193840.1 thermonuclease family protein [Blastocatellia bacterium]MBN8724469.1 thermonuclease family protein [Acidobacteriota bacterium]